MAPTEDTLNSINYIISVYIGYLTITTGLIGNIINILVFTQLKLFRKNQSAFYLTMTSINECYQLIFVTSTRVITTTFGYDLTRKSIVWCRFRAYLSQLGSTTLPIIICFAAIDQYMSTSYHIRLRQMSTFELAQSLICILLISASLYSISFPFFNEIHSSIGCATYNPAYNYFYSFVHLCIIIGIGPIVISSLFSLLAYRNVRRITRRQMPIVRRRLDRQVTAMVLVRVALYVIVTLPLVSIRTYQINNLVDENNTYAVAVDQLIKITVITFNNINYSGSFYVFWATSSRFRRQVKYLFIKKIWQKCLAIGKNRNQVEPANQLQNVEPNASAMDAD